MTAQAADRPETAAGTPEQPQKSKTDDEAPMAMCPMAKMCRGMMEKPGSGLIPTIIGVVVIALAIAIVIEPAIVVWLVAIALILMGLMMLMSAGFIRRGSARFRRMGTHSHP